MYLCNIKVEYYKFYELNFLFALSLSDIMKNINENKHIIRKYIKLKCYHIIDRCSFFFFFLKRKKKNIIKINNINN